MMPRGVYVRSAQARANMSAAAKARAHTKAAAPPVGYGKRGHAFRSKKKYNQSMEGQRHAADPSLSTKPVATGAKGNKFFSQRAANIAKAAKAQKAAAKRPTATMSGPRKGGGSGTVARRPVKR